MVNIATDHTEINLRTSRLICAYRMPRTPTRQLPTTLNYPPAALTFMLPFLVEVALFTPIVLLKKVYIIVDCGGFVQQGTSSNFTCAKIVRGT